MSSTGQKQRGTVQRDGLVGRHPTEHVKTEHKKENNVHYYHKMKVCWKTLLASRKTMQARSRYKNRVKIRAPQKGPENWCRAKIVENVFDTF